jgi:hypothetical protein
MSVRLQRQAKARPGSAAGWTAAGGMGGAFGLSLRGEPMRNILVRNLFALAFFAMSLLFAITLTACGDNASDADYYDNDIHNGYPGPGTKTPNQD